MALSKADRDEIRGLLHDQGENIEKLTAAQFTSITEKLDTIILKQTEANGRVAKHEERLQKIERDLPHTITSCPQRDIIQELRDNLITKRSLKRITVTAVTIAIAIVGTITSVVALIIKAQ